MFWQAAWFYLHLGLAIGPFTSESECWRVRKAHVEQGRAPHADVCVRGWEERARVHYAPKGQNWDKS